MKHFSLVVHHGVNIQILHNMLFILIIQEHELDQIIKEFKT